jgi:hypothetical protein
MAFPKEEEAILPLPQVLLLAAASPPAQLPGASQQEPWALLLYGGVAGWLLVF